MKTVPKAVFYLFLAMCSAGLLGCGKKADEDKPISEVKAEAEKMSVKDLRATAMTYKESISAKTAEIEKVMGKLKDIPIAEKLGTEAKELSTEVESLTKSLSALKERFRVYYDKLKEKGGDLSGLEI